MINIHAVSTSEPRLSPLLLRPIIMSDLPDIREESKQVEEKGSVSGSTSHPPPGLESSIPSTPEKQPKRRGSTASRVDVEFFDPQGVNELQRTLTNHQLKHRDSSETTVGKPFDLKSVLLDEVRK